MAQEATLGETDAGLVPEGEGWFVLNAREVSWWRSDERGQDTDFEGRHEWAQLGFRILPAVDAAHLFVGAGDGPCVIVTAGARHGENEIVYPVNEVAARHGASFGQETPSPKEAYAPYPREPLFTPYREGDLPWAPLAGRRSGRRSRPPADLTSLAT